MGLRDAAREDVARQPEQSQGAPGPVVAAAEQKALGESVRRAQEREAAEGRTAPPPANVYYPEHEVMGDGATVFGKDASRAVEVRPDVIEYGGLRLTAQQYAMLMHKIDPRRVKYKLKQSHLEAWDVRRHLIRIFGFGGFKIETVSKEKIHEKLTAPGEGKVTRWVSGEKRKMPNEDWMYTVVYDAVVRLTVFGLDGTSATFEDAATGDGINMPSYQAAADFAIKTAESQALKRCAVNLGDQFGLSLYNGGSLDPVIQVTLIGPVIEDRAVERAAESGEVHPEPEPVLDNFDPDDPGSDAGPNGLPTASDLRDEALAKSTTLTRLSAIYKMVHRSKGDHRELGATRVINETGDEEALDTLVYRKIQERKTGGETE